MPKYQVEVEQTNRWYITVEAEDEDHAEEQVGDQLQTLGSLEELEEPVFEDDWEIVSTQETE